MNKKLSYLIVALVLIGAVVGYAGAQVGIGISTPDPSAALDIASTTQGVLLPRIAADGDISNPAEGLTVYNTTDNCIKVYDGTAWTCAVGGSNGNSGGSGFSNVTGNFASTTAITVLPPRFYGSFYMDQTWIDDDTFAVAEGHGGGWATGTPYADERLIRLFNSSFAEQGRFVLPNLAGGSQTLVAVLKNGNLLFSAQSGSPNGLQVMITQQDGTVVKAWELIGSSGSMPRKIIVLDDGKVLIREPTFKFHLFSEAGTLIQSITPSVTVPDQNYDIAPTDFGFIIVAGVGTTNKVTTLYSYDFGGNEIASQPFEADTTALFGSQGGSLHSDLMINLTRISGNQFYAGGRRPRPGSGTTANPPWDEYDGSTTSPTDHMLTAIRKFEVNANGTFTTLYEAETFPELALDRYSSGTSHSRIVSAAPDGQLYAFGAKEPDILFGLTMPSDRTSNVGQSLPLLRFATDGSFVDETNIVQAGAMIEPSGFRDLTLPFNDNYRSNVYGSATNVIAISPAGTTLFVSYFAGSNPYSTIANGLGHHYLLLDPTTMEIKPTQLQANNLPQDLRTQFGIAAPLNNPTKIELTIIDGAGTFDAINCLACGIDVSSSYSPAAKKLTLNNASGNADSNEFSIALNYLTFAPDSPAGTRTFEIKLFTADGSVSSTTFEVEVVNP